MCFRVILVLRNLVDLLNHVKFPHEALLVFSEENAVMVELSEEHSIPCKRLLIYYSRYMNLNLDMGQTDTVIVY